MKRGRIHMLWTLLRVYLAWRHRPDLRMCQMLEMMATDFGLDLYYLNDNDL